MGKPTCYIIDHTRYNIQDHKPSLLKKDIIMGNVAGLRRRGWPRRRWINDTEYWTGRCSTSTSNRHQWKQLVHHVADL